jgi:hypothetical protein
VRLTEELLRTAAGTQLTDLRTVEAERAPLGGGRVRRRPERVPEAPAGEAPHASGQPSDEQAPAPGELDSDRPADVEPAPEPEPPAPAAPGPAPAGTAKPAFAPPILGWDTARGNPVRWLAAGEGALPNGHVEIWGSSGAGKTEFTKSLLAQLATFSGARFGIADFKNDYGGDFPAHADARFIDLWGDGAPFNPLALPADSDRAIQRAVIELRDTVDVATQSFTRMGVRQKAKLKDALQEAYAIGRQERRWPTLLTLNSLLDDDLAGVIGDLTSTEIFGEGAPLGDATDENLVFGLSQIPGNGLTTVLAAGFILSALQLKIQGLEQVPNTIRYAIVVDEAHRVSAFKAIDTMIREGRSKGLAVLLATQQPGDSTRSTQSCPSRSARWTWGRLSSASAAPPPGCCAWPSIGEIAPNSGSAAKGSGAEGSQRRERTPRRPRPRRPARAPRGAALSSQPARAAPCSLGHAPRCERASGPSSSHSTAAGGRESGSNARSSRPRRPRPWRV